MNKRIRELAERAFFDNASGQPSDRVYTFSDHKMQQFAELIVGECCNRLSKETIRHDGYGYNQHELYRRLREHFGVKE